MNNISPRPERAQTPRVRIRGGAGSYHAAAIAAVVEHVLAREHRASAPTPHRFSNWMMAIRSGPFIIPRTPNGAIENGAEQPPAPRRVRS